MSTVQETLDMLVNDSLYAIGLRQSAEAQKARVLLHPEDLNPEQVAANAAAITTALMLSEDILDDVREQFIQISDMDDESHED